MRISAHKDSPFFWQNSFKNPEIYLDDVPVEDVVEADTDAGYVRVIDYAPGNHPRYAGGEYLTKVLTGKVRIEESQKEV